MLNFIKNIIKYKEEKNLNFLENNLKRFEYIANSVSKKKIDILESNDNIGGYYNNKIILPTDIISLKYEKKKFNCFVYKILFSTISNNKDFYLPENKKNLDYILVASMITVKTINKKIKTIYPNFKNLIKEINPIIIKLRQNNQTLLELILKKLMYEKNKTKLKLNEEEKKLIYHIENITHITKSSIKKNIENTNNKLKKITNQYKNIDLNVLWGYLYYKKTNKDATNIKNIIQQSKKNNEIKIEKNILKKNNKLEKKNITYLNVLFDYKKTLDNYKKGNKSTDSKETTENSNNLKDLNLDTSAKTTETTSSIIKNKILNEITILKDKSDNQKKYSYKEWDLKSKKYKNNWCNVFVKKKINNNNENQLYINNIIKLNKNTIKKIKDKISLIVNEKLWKKKQTHGEDIDFDTIIDNYKEIKNENFNNIYKYKKKYIKNTAIIILFDSSLSTDGYINEKKIIELIKELTIILASSINTDIPKNSIATFYSNTRHDCTYKIIKNIKEKKIKSDIKNINSNGYTRIGPAIRHSIKEISNIKCKKKIIILLTDGNPTDYDEYEGEYGVNDIKMALTEAKKLKILIKCITTNNKSNQDFIKIFKNDNLTLKKNISSKELINFIKKTLKE